MLEFSSKRVKVRLPYRGGGERLEWGVGEVLTVLPYIKITFFYTLIAMKVNWCSATAPVSYPTFIEEPPQ